MSFPFIIVPIVFWAAKKVYDLEKEVVEIKTDLKWLVSIHKDKTDEHFDR